MKAEFTYLWVDFFCIIVPFIFSFHPKLKFVNQWRYFILPCITTALLFILWDILFTSIGIWHFNPRYVLGYYVLNLPVEEILFFICIPYACVFTYYCFSKFYNFSFGFKTRYFGIVLILFLMVTAIFNLTKLYTSFTFILTSACLLFLIWKKADYLTVFFISFIVILIPFFISNGILTGSFIDEPVVVYNDKHNLNIRLFTIPFEDIFYGMLLFLLNVIGFEWMKSRFRLTNIK